MDEGIWVLKVFVKIFLLAFVGIMIFRILFWADRCVINRIHVYPPVYQCAVRPFNFTDNNIKMLEHNNAMSEWVRADAKVEDSPFFKKK